MRQPKLGGMGVNMGSMMGAPKISGPSTTSPLATLARGAKSLPPGARMPGRPQIAPVPRFASGGTVNDTMAALSAGQQGQPQGQPQYNAFDALSSLAPNMGAMTNNPTMRLIMALKQQQEQRARQVAGPTQQGAQAPQQQQGRQPSPQTGVQMPQNAPQPVSPMGTGAEGQTDWAAMLANTAPPPQQAFAGGGQANQSTLAKLRELLLRSQAEAAAGRAASAPTGVSPVAPVDPRSIGGANPANAGTMRELADGGHVGMTHRSSHGQMTRDLIDADFSPGVRDTVGSLGPLALAGMIPGVSRSPIGSMANQVGNASWMATDPTAAPTLIASLLGKSIPALGRLNPLLMAMSQGAYAGDAGAADEMEDLRNSTAPRRFGPVESALSSPRPMSYAGWAR